MNYRVSIAPPSPAAGGSRGTDDRAALIASSAMLDSVDEWQGIVADTKRILVAPTGQAGSPGRPFAAIALARALAGADLRVVAIDLHGDNAANASLGEASDRPGFADLLEGRASYADVILRDQHSRIHFIPNGQRPLSAADLRSDGRLETILEALSITYDYVVLEVEDDAVMPLAPFFPVAMVTTETGAADPRTALAIARISAASDANIHLLVADAAAHTVAEERDEAAPNVADTIPMGKAA